MKNNFLLKKLNIYDAKNNKKNIIPMISHK